jgi:hypothetical protein
MNYFLYNCWDLKIFSKRHIRSTFQLHSVITYLDDGKKREERYVKTIVITTTVATETNFTEDDFYKGLGLKEAYI